MNKGMISKLALSVCMSLAFVGCGNDNDSSDNTTQTAAKQKISGIAATGAALNGTVMAVNAKGEESQAVTVSADGSYTLSINQAPPYMIKAVSNNLKGADGKPLELFSYVQNGNIANVTTLTTQALYSVSNKGNLKTFYDNWKANAASVTNDKVNEAAKKVVANLNDQFKAAGVTDTPNVFTTSFKTDGTGLDKVLDNFKAVYTCASPNSCSVDYKVDGQSYTWNYDVSTDKITFDASNTAAAGSSTLTITGTSKTNGISVAIPKIVLNNISKPSNQDEFCNGSSNQKFPDGFSQTNCSFSNSVGKIGGKVSITQSNITINSEYQYTYTYS